MGRVVGDARITHALEWAGRRPRAEGHARQEPGRIPGLSAVARAHETDVRRTAVEEAANLEHGDDRAVRGERVRLDLGRVLAGRVRERIRANPCQRNVGARGPARDDEKEDGRRADRGHTPPVNPACCPDTPARLDRAGTPPSNAKHPDLPGSETLANTPTHPPEHAEPGLAHRCWEVNTPPRAGSRRRRSFDADDTNDVAARRVLTVDFGNGRGMRRTVVAAVAALLALPAPAGTDGPGIVNFPDVSILPVQDGTVHGYLSLRSRRSTRRASAGSSRCSRARSPSSRISARGPHL